MSFEVVQKDGVERCSSKSNPSFITKLISFKIRERIEGSNNNSSASPVAQSYNSCESHHNRFIPASSLLFSVLMPISHPLRARSS